MTPNRPAFIRQPVSNVLLLLLILSLPLMKPAIAYPIVLPDLIFATLLLVLLAELLSGRLRLAWEREYWVPVLYLVSLAPSLLATPDLPRSLFKLTTQLYLVSLALLTAALIRNETQLRSAVLAWLAGTAIVAAVSVASLASFPFGPDNPLVNFARFHFGTLPPAHYPRLSSTFLNANMACNYLSISALVLLAARHCGWVSKSRSVILLAGIAFAGLATISPGLGGLVLALALWFWLQRQAESPILARTALAAGLAVAICSIIATAVTPILHSTAPFLIQLPGTELTLAPSARLMLWIESLKEFGRNPLIGHGIGIDATFVRYLDPSGDLQFQTDAHNSFLNIAAQCGLVGLLGLVAVLLFAARLTRPWRSTDCAGAVRVALGLSFLCAFAFQGLSGSFEDTRHLWLLLGLLMAAARLSRGDGNNHRAGVPSPG